MGTLINRPCAAFYNHGWQTGKIVKHDMKNGFCIVDTMKYGKIRVTIYKIYMTDKEE